MMNRPNAVWRGLAMLGAILLVIALSLGNTGWAQVARAQTVPTLTFTPAATALATPRPTASVPAPATDTSQSLATSTPAGPTATVSADLAACGPGPYRGETPANDLTAQVRLGAGSVQLLSPDGLDADGKSTLTVTHLEAEVVVLGHLPRAPASWRLLTCGLQPAAVDATGQAASFLTGGFKICLTVPPDVSAATDVRLAYFDPRPGIVRWVFTRSEGAAGQICSARFHLPATFALLARST